MTNYTATDAKQVGLLYSFRCQSLDRAKSGCCADRLRPALAAKWLAAMPAEEALAETEQMTAASVSAALSAMKPLQAASIIQVLKDRFLQRHVEPCASHCMGIEQPCACARLFMSNNAHHRWKAWLRLRKGLHTSQLVMP